MSSSSSSSSSTTTSSSMSRHQSVHCPQWKKKESSYGVVVDNMSVSEDLATCIASEDSPEVDNETISSVLEQLDLGDDQTDDFKSNEVHHHHHHHHHHHQPLQKSPAYGGGRSLPLLSASVWSQNASLDQCSSSIDQITNQSLQQQQQQGLLSMPKSSHHDQAYTHPTRNQAQQMQKQSLPLEQQYQNQQQEQLQMQQNHFQHPLPPPPQRLAQPQQPSDITRDHYVQSLQGFQSPTQHPPNNQWPQQSEQQSICSDVSAITLSNIDSSSKLNHTEAKTADSVSITADNSPNRTDKQKLQNGSDNTAPDSSEKEKKNSNAKPYQNYFRKVYVPLPKQRYSYMSHSEISIVIRQQLQQLQTKNPMDDDFYFQVFSARNGEEWNGVGFPGVEITGPPVINRFRGLDGSPILPVGTLGRVVVSSIRQPRMLLQLSTASETVSNDEEKSDDNSVKAKKFMFAHRSIDFVIEEGIRLIMDVEDVDSLLEANPRTADEHQQQAQLYQQRSALGQRLLERMSIREVVDDQGRPLAQPLPLPMPDADHLVFKYGTIAKGRNFLLRAMMLMSQDQVYRLLHVVMSRLCLFALPVDECSFDASTSLVMQKYLDMWMPQQITGLFHSFITGEENMRNIVKLAASKAGAVALLCFCKRGHELRSAPQTPPPDIMAWLELYNQVFAALAPRFEEMFPVDEDNFISSSSSSLLSDIETRWRILADLSSHASPMQLGMVTRSKHLWTLVNNTRLQQPPAHYFASLIEGLTNTQMPLHENSTQ